MADPDPPSLKSKPTQTELPQEGSAFPQSEAGTAGNEGGPARQDTREAVSGDRSQEANRGEDASNSADTASQEESADQPGQDPGSARDGNIVSFNDTYHIRLDKRLPNIDNGPVKAYEAFSQAHKTMFAMICEPHLVPRFRDSEIYSKHSDPALLKYVASGTLYWPLESAYRHVIFYEGSPGRPLLESPTGAALGWKPERVMRSFLKPMFSALKSLRDLDLYHGHIRLDNIFGEAGDSTFDQVSLGDCLSLPPNYTRHNIYLPAQKALAMPEGRGAGSISDDLYSLGVCTALLLRSADPAKGMNDKDIMKMKLAQGSYITLTNKDRFSGGVLELLRGLLQDEPSQRWTMEEVLSWLEGQRLVPKQVVKRNKAARPIALGDKRYYYTETLALDMHDRLSESVQLIESDALTQWITRSIENTRMVDKLEEGVRMAREYGRTSYYQERLVSRITIILDPKQPIRYRGLSVFPDGFGTAMATAFNAGQDMSPFVHLIKQLVIPYWLGMQAETSLDVGSLTLAFENCRNSLNQTALGYGVERCMYVLSPECPCLSEQYKDFVIREAPDLLVALEDLAEKKKMPRKIFDPHTISFLLVRHNRLIDPYLTEISAKEEFRRILGEIKTLAAIQRAADIKDLKHLTRWAGDYIKPFFDRYHDRNTREEKLEEIDKIKNRGDIKALLKTMDDPRALQKDSIEFKRALKNFYRLKLESYRHEKALLDREKYGLTTGREMAAIASALAASIIILVVTFIFFSGGSVIP